MSYQSYSSGIRKFWKEGYVGAREVLGDKVLIPTDLHYEDMVVPDEYWVYIVKRGGKWALADEKGKPLCDFLYDRIVYIGEGYFKAGVYVKPDDGEIILEYIDTRMVYAILDKEGKLHSSLSKRFNFIDRFHNGETTAAIDGRCGIIDTEGNIIVECKYKFVSPLGEGHYLVRLDNSDNTYSTVIDKEGNVLISASMEYRSIEEFHKGVAVATRFTKEGLKWGLVNDKGRCMVDFAYQYIQYWGEGCYRVEKGAKKNLIKSNGKLVLSEWFNDIFDIHHGFFIFGNTIRKTKTTPTRYISGVATVKGDMVFPMIFEKVRWIDNYQLIYGEIDGRPYFLTLNGSIYDLQNSHLPQKLVIDDKSFFENMLNWVMPGLQFFYRDTDAIDDAKKYYYKGQTLRAGFFVDVTTKLWRPRHKTRFLIASAHAARLFEMDGLVKANPDVGKWNLTTLHYNSYFKVMDVYETPTCTQVFLLHVPMSAALLMGDSDFRFIDEASGTERTLTEMARQSLDDKLKMDIHPRSMDEVFCKRMEATCGFILLQLRQNLQTKEWHH